jgi:glycosyltransferase involved in cell wall biosynthesis
MQVHHFFGKTIYFEASWPIATFVYLSEKFALQRYRKLPFIAVSESTANELKHSGIPDDKIKIIYNGIRREVFYPDESVHRSDAPTIVYLGRIKAYKRVDVLIRAMHAIRERVPGARLVIIGSGDGIKPLRELADSLSLTGEAIHFAGFVTEEQKVKYLRESWIAVNTSPKEGWGIVGMEAQACGTPVMVSDAPGLRESIRDGETGFLFPFGDVSALTEKVTTLLTSPELRMKMGRSAAEWAHRFTWEKAAEDTDRAIEDLLSGRF